MGENVSFTNGSILESIDCVRRVRTAPRRTQVSQSELFIIAMMCRLAAFDKPQVPGEPNWTRTLDEGG